jgi:hypothetical protein
MIGGGNREFPSHKTEPAPFAGRATDLGALRDAVVDAAGVSTGLWLSYLFVLSYFAIAAGAVTHCDLFLENPVKLPFLNVELPLKAFFILGPLVFLIVHTYVLLHFVLLAGKIGAFHGELQAQIAGDDARARLRRQLPNNIFVQSLAGPREVPAREGLHGPHTGRRPQSNPISFRVIGVLTALGSHAVEFEDALARERLLEPVEELSGRVDLIVVLALGEDGQLVGGIRQASAPSPGYERSRSRSSRSAARIVKLSGHERNSR